MTFILIDRDGVINEDSDQFIKSPAEWQAIPDSLEAIALLNRHGYRVAVLTNQSGIARGLFDLTTLQAIHDKMRQLVLACGGKIDAIYFCPHAPDGDCLCRKPKPGLFQAFAKDFAVDLTALYSIGDSYRDIEASLAVHAKPILVKTGKGLQTLSHHPSLNIPVFENLYDAAQFIITQKNA